MNKGLYSSESGKNGTNPLKFLRQRLPGNILIDRVMADVKNKISKTLIVLRGFFIYLKF